MALDTVLSYLMVFFGCLFYVKGVTGVIIAQNLWVLTVFSILAWGIFVVFRYIRCSRLMKTSITVALCGAWMFFANTLISVAYNRVVRPSVNFQLDGFRWTKYRTGGSDHRCGDGRSEYDPGCEKITSIDRGIVVTI